MDQMLSSSSSSVATIASSSSAEGGAAISTSLHLVLLLLSRSSLLGAIWAARHILALLVCSGLLAILAWWRHPGGPAWGLAAARANSHSTIAKEIRGPRGWPLVGSLLELMGERPHVKLANLARAHSAKSLMAFSLGSTRVILTSEPSVARELLSSSSFADRPIKQSAKLLLFHRAIGFAPYGDYWRTLRRIAATHLFAPRRLSALEPCRQFETAQLLQSIHAHAESGSSFEIRTLLQLTSINNIMKSVFGRRYDFSYTQKQEALVQADPEAEKLRGMIREGFELLGAFNWSDHLPFLKWLDLQGVHSRCTKLVAEVQDFVQTIIDEHRARHEHGPGESSVDDAEDFVDVLLSLQSSEKLSDTDIIAILWEMIFRGTDTTAILMEWILAEMVLHPEVQASAQAELDVVVGRCRTVQEADMALLPYVNAIIKETLRMHPPGPLLSWARLATCDVELAGHHVPKGTTAMVNMWAITHDEDIWEKPDQFVPDRFVKEDVDVRGGDLRLAPFGAGRRVCPGRAMGLVTVQLWTARLLHHFTWSLPEGKRACDLDLTEILKLSSEMKTPLRVTATPRIVLPFA